VQAGTILWGIDDALEGAGVSVAVLLMGVDVVIITDIGITVPITSIEIAVLLLRCDSLIAVKLIHTTCFIIHS